MATTVVLGLVGALLPGQVLAQDNGGPAPTPPAAEPPPAAFPPPSAALIGDDRLQPGVASVAVRSPSYDAAVAAYDGAIAQIRIDGAALTVARTRLGALAAEQEVRREHGDVLRADRRATAVRLTQVERSMRELAIASFVAQGSADDPTIYLLEGGLPEPELRRQLTAEAATARTDERRALIDSLTDLDAALEANDARLGEVAVTALDVGASAEVLAARLDDLAGRLPDLAEDVRRSRRLATVEGTDLSLVALDAYVAAANRLAVDEPACNLSWWMLAGIGRVESRHGTFGASALRQDGRTTTPIIGIPLDGTNGTLLIPDTDRGLLDGDPIYDRAVGPMQFIPGTWNTWAGDGNGDGRADPHNLYDAALTAGAYLCNRGGDLGTASGRTRAYFAYNRSDRYVAAVSSYGQRYAPVIIPAPDQASAPSADQPPQP